MATAGSGVCEDHGPYSGICRACLRDMAYAQGYQDAFNERDGSRDDQFSQLADALEGLYDVYKPEGVGIWLKGAKRSLDGRSPLDLIRNGEIWELAAMVERMRSGAAT